jgi:hypothetical protein
MPLFARTSFVLLPYAFISKEYPLSTIKIGSPLKRADSFLAFIFVKNGTVINTNEAKRITNFRVLPRDFLVFSKYNL